MAGALDCGRLNGLEVLDGFDNLDRVVSREGTAPYFVSGHMRGSGNVLVARIIARHLVLGHARCDE